MFSSLSEFAHYTLLSVCVYFCKFKLQAITVEVGAEDEEKRELCISAMLCCFCFDVLADLLITLVAVLPLWILVQAGSGSASGSS